MELEAADMYTDSQLARDVESRDDALLAERDNAAARQDHHAARVEEVRGPLERRMVTAPTTDEQVQAMASVLEVDGFGMNRAWKAISKTRWLIDRRAAFAELGEQTFLAVSAELRKMADTAAEAQVQREERELEGEARKSRRVVLGDEY